MKNILKAFVLGLILLPSITLAVGVSLDYNAGILQPFSNISGAVFRINSITSTSTTNNNTLPRVVSTHSTSTNLFATNASGTNMYGFGLGTCNGATQALIWSAGKYGCQTISATGDGVSNWLFNGSRLSPSTTVGIGVFASSTIGGGTGTSGLTINGTATSTNSVITALAPSRVVFTDVSDLLTSTGASAALLNSLSDEVGTGFAVFNGSPVFTGTAQTVGLAVSGTSTLGFASSTALTVSGIANLSSATGTTFVGFGLTDCKGASNALIWDITTSKFGCNTIVGGTGALSDWNQSLGTYLTPSTTVGIRVNASSTIGNATGAGGLTISGTGTSTNFAVTALTPSRVVFSDASDMLTSTGVSLDVLNSVTDETGTGALVFANGATFTGTPTFQNIFMSTTGSSTLGFASTTALTVANNAYLNTFTANSGTTTNLFVTNASTTNFWGAGINTCNGAQQALTWVAGRYGCATLMGVGDGVSNWNQALVAGVLSPSTTVGIRVNASSTIGNGTGTGGLTISGTATTTNFKVTALTASRAVFTGADNLFTSTGASLDLLNSISDETGTGLAVFATNPLLSGFRSNASSTIGGGTAITGLTVAGGATTTQLVVGAGGATTSAIFATTASSTNLFANLVTLGSNILRIVGNAVNLLGTWDFGSATALEIPNAASPTVNVLGQIAYNTTNNSISVATSTTFAELPLLPPLSFAVSSSSWTGTSTEISYPTTDWDELITTGICYANGTGKIIVGNGTASSTLVNLASGTTSVAVNLRFNKTGTRVIFALGTSVGMTTANCKFGRYYLR